MSLGNYLLNTSGQKYLVGIQMARLKMTQDQIIARFKTTHGDRFDYSLFDYAGITSQATIICREHGVFSCSPDRHFRGDGCPKCSINQRAKTKTLTHDQFVAKATQTHNGFYDYSKSVYINAKTKIKITCPDHGEFMQGANAHIRGAGCPTCIGRKISVKKRKSAQRFMDQLKELYGDRFDVSLAEYQGGKHSVKLICDAHGKFERLAKDLLQGYSCPSCATKPVSQKETEWLNSLNVPAGNRQVRVKLTDGSYIIADGFMNNTVYEFWGDFWHGNPQTHPEGINKRSNMEFKELYAQTCAKIQRILESGYNLVQIWESEWSPSSVKADRA